MNHKILISIFVVILVGIIGVGSYFIVSKNNDTNTVNNNQSSNVQNNGNSESEVSNEKKEEENMDQNKKIVIIYFSATGTTKIVAEYIQEETKGDLIEIVPQDKYTDSDLNYNNNNGRANIEQNDSKARPEIANKIDVSSYDTIYLGYPIWWGDVPKIILTFLDTYDLSGKTVIPFCTSHSSGISGSLNTLNNYNKNINWKDGKRFSSSSKNEVKNWVNGGN